MDDHLNMDEPGDERYILGLVAGVCAVEPVDEESLGVLAFLLRRAQEAHQKTGERQ